MFTWILRKNSASYSPVVKYNANTNCGSDYIAYRQNKNAIEVLLYSQILHLYMYMQINLIINDKILGF